MGYVFFVDFYKIRLLFRLLKSHPIGSLGDCRLVALDAKALKQIDYNWKVGSSIPDSHRLRVKVSSVILSPALERRGANPDASYKGRGERKI